MERPEFTCLNSGKWTANTIGIPVTIYEHYSPVWKADIYSAGQVISCYYENRRKVNITKCQHLTLIPIAPSVSKLIYLSFHMFSFSWVQLLSVTFVNVDPTHVSVGTNTQHHTNSVSDPCASSIIIWRRLNLSELQSMVLQWCLFGGKHLDHFLIMLKWVGVLNPSRETAVR